jgi:thioredoxin-like negative regulator of GroEL
VDKLKSISLQHGAQNLPTLVLFVKNRPLTYLGVQAVDQVIGFIQKQIAPPVKELKSVSEVITFLSSRTDKKNSISTVMVVSDTLPPTRPRARLLFLH